MGLFGKLPARGDFVRHGWSDATIEALDAWLSGGLEDWRSRLGDAGAAQALAAAPLLRFYTPPGWAGSAALHGCLSPSVDRAGRFFFLAAGIEARAEAAWHLAVWHPGFADHLETALYAALSPGADLPELIDAVDRALPDGNAAPWRASLATPSDALFWAEPEGESEPFVVRAAAPVPEVLDALLQTGTA